MFKRILVPIDASETSRRALAYAQQLAALKGAQLRIVHVFDDVVYLHGFEYDSGALPAARAYAAQLLTDVAVEAHAAGAHVDKKLLEGSGRSLGEAVAEEARAWNADLVVVGSHGRRGIGRAILGSGAEQVIRLAPVPVLVVR